VVLRWICPTASAESVENQWKPHAQNAEKRCDQAIYTATAAGQKCQK